VSWQQLESIRAEARELAQLDLVRPLVDCPVCATRLQAGPGGKLDCPMGDWSES
jgi:hypothetical protein